MKALKTLLKFVVLLLPLIFGACKNDLIRETTHDYNEHKNAADYNDYILPPQTVTASTGQARCVKLSWTPVKNAVRYQIFSAETPFDTFTKVIETKDAETEVILDEFSGITKYYTVCAVNYYGTVSSQSCVTEGSTIAVPIITGIESSEEGSSVTVSWWMDNCTAATYQNEIAFNVYVYKAGAPTVVLQKVQVAADKRSAVIEGLSSMTEYEFIVEAERKDLSAKETGSRTSAETAHRIIPDAPVNFAVEQGQSTTDISLSWELPSGAWYKENSGQSGFVLHPLYFKIFRKEAESEDAFEELLAIGAERETPADWKFEAKPAVFFNCKTFASVTKNGDDASTYVIVTAPATVNPELLAPAAPYDSYIPGSKIVFKDTTAVRGKKYEYYIQTITDDTPNGKTITADSCIAGPEVGWQISKGLFSIQSDYVRNEEDNDIFESISFAYNFNFESNQIPYTYIIEQTKFALDDENEENPVKTLKVYNSLDDLNAAKAEFLQPAQEVIGYYRYKLYLCKADVTTEQAQSEIDNAFAEFAASGKYLVTDDASKVPTIEDFELKDGYKDHYALSWKYNPDYSYIIHFTDKNVDGSEEETLVLAADDECFDGLSNGDTVTFNHEADSGDRRIYTLEASIGLSASVRPNGNTTDVIYETLGTPVPSITTYDYDKITVSWPVVQKATGDYSVSARYADADPSQNLVTDENTQITINGQIVKCVLAAPDGYNDAVLAGKPIEFTVTAINTLTADTSEAAVEVCTVGPALTEAKIETTQFDRINFSWKKVKGAKGYLIHRIRYADGRCSATADNGQDTYYFDGETLLANGTAVDQNIACVVTNGNLFTLNDKYCDVTDNTSPYQRNQSIIKWGMPYGYIVVPVSQSGSDTDFIFDGRNMSLQTQEPVDYTNTDLIEKRGATFGYGFKVHAQKSQSSSQQIITWQAPFYDDKNPSVYSRVYGEGGDWLKIDNVDYSQENQCATFTPVNKNIAYEYLVAYNKASTSISSDYLPPSFVSDTVSGLNLAESDYDYAALKQQNPDIQNETANKGYLLSVKYKARTGPDYSEIVEWDEWDYTERSIGPDSAVLYIKNYNLSSEWNALASINGKLHYENATENLDNTTIGKYNNSNIEVMVAPAVLMDGTSANPVTRGLLQVLRDAKHYYALELKRGDNSFMIGDDEEVYTYRNISEKELVKCALLNVAYAFYLDAKGLENLSNVVKTDDNTLLYQEKNPSFNGTGSATFKKMSVISLLVWDPEVGKYKADVTLTDFAPLMLTPSGTKSCVVAVTMDNVNTRLQGLSDAWVDKFRSEGFTVTVVKADTKMPPSYSGTMTMTCTSDSNLMVKINNTTINVSDSAERKRYFPLKFASDDRYWLKDPTYGWWIVEENN